MRIPWLFHMFSPVLTAILVLALLLTLGFAAGFLAILRAFAGISEALSQNSPDLDAGALERLAVRVTDLENRSAERDAHFADQVDALARMTKRLAVRADRSSQADFVDGGERDRLLKLRRG